MKVEIGTQCLGLIPYDPEHSWKREWTPVEVVGQYNGNWVVVDLTLKHVHWCSDFKEGDRPYPRIGEVWSLTVASEKTGVVVNNVSGYMVKGVTLSGQPIEFSYNTPSCKKLYDNLAMFINSLEEAD